MKKSELRSEWEQRIAHFISSGQSASKWCVANELSIHQFWYWKRRLKTFDTTETDSTKWMSVVMEESVEDSSKFLFVRVGQATVEVKPGFDPALLANVVRTLQSLC